MKDVQLGDEHKKLLSPNGNKLPPIENDDK
jgi:hypothetical protein